jgi:hypothetical protein
MICHWTYHGLDSLYGLLQLGGATLGSADTHVATLVLFSDPFVFVSLGQDFSCAIGNKSSALYCWGDNSNKQVVIFFLKFVLDSTFCALFNVVV